MNATKTPKADRLDALLAELDPISTEINQLLYDANDKLRTDQTPEEEARLNTLFDQSDALTRRITGVVKE